MAKNTLSKSTYIKGKQCHKQLYLYKNRYFLRDKMPPERLATFKRGTDIGVLARQLFPGGVDCSPKSPSQYSKAVEWTAQNIASGTSIIYEAGFIANQTIVLLDILVSGDDGWSAYEVKSSIAISDTYLEDAALQYYVIKKSGLNLKKFGLIIVNPEYVLQSEMDLSRFFKVIDVTSEVESRIAKVEVEIESQLEVLASPSSPKINVGKHCFSPYECDFIGHCWGDKLNERFMTMANLTMMERVSVAEHGFDFLLGTEKFNLAKLYFDFSEKAINFPSQVNEIIENRNPIKIIKPIWSKSALPIFKGNKPYERLLIGFAQAVIDGSSFKSDSFNMVIFNQEEVLDENSISGFFEKLEQQNLVFMFDEVIHPKNPNLINIFDLLSSGEVFLPGLTDFKFRNVFKLLKGREPYFAGSIKIDQQVTPYYESFIKSNSRNDLNEIEMYMKENIDFTASILKSLFSK